MEKILALGFLPSATAVRDGNGWDLNISSNRAATNVLYAFVFKSNAEERVVYVGHTRKTFENRMQGYQRGAGESVNNRVHRAVDAQLTNGGEVEVYCLPNTNQMALHGIPVDLAAGLEYGLIKFYAEYNRQNSIPPLLNIAGNQHRLLDEHQHEQEAADAERLEEELDNDLPLVPALPAADTPAFDFELTEKTYWPAGSINIRSEFQHYFSPHGGVVQVALIRGNQPATTVEAVINRTANLNGTPRLLFQGNFGKVYKQWKQENHLINDLVHVRITAHDCIQLI
jgi:hypothetical protein